MDRAKTQNKTPKGYWLELLLPYSKSIKKKMEQIATKGYLLGFNGDADIKFG